MMIVTFTYYNEKPYPHHEAKIMDGENVLATGSSTPGFNGKPKPSVALAVEEALRNLACKLRDARKEAVQSYFIDEQEQDNG